MAAPRLVDGAKRPGKHVLRGESAAGGRGLHYSIRTGTAFADYRLDRWIVRGLVPAHGAGTWIDSTRSVRGDFMALSRISVILAADQSAGSAVRVAAFGRNRARAIRPGHGPLAAGLRSSSPSAASGFTSSDRGSRGADSIRTERAGGAASGLPRRMETNRRPPNENCGGGSASARIIKFASTELDCPDPVAFGTGAAVDFTETRGRTRTSVLGRRVERTIR